MVRVSGDSESTSCSDAPIAGEVRQQVFYRGGRLDAGGSLPKTAEDPAGAVVAVVNSSLWAVIMPTCDR